VSFNYNDLSIEGERGTGRKQVHMKPFFQFKSNQLFSVAASLEIVANNTGKTSAYSWAFLTRMPRSQ
jgi:hypothetical protein